MTKSESLKVYAVLIAAFPNANVRNETPDVYATGISDLDYELANGAVRRLLLTSKFMPSIAEIREAALEAQSGQRMNGGEAWGIAKRAMRGQGACKTPGVDFTFRDPIIAQCIRALGWQELCLSENDIADRARFIELYDQLARGERKETQIAHGLALVPNPSTPRLAPTVEPEFVDPEEARRLVAGVRESLRTGTAPTIEPSEDEIKKGNKP